MDGGKGEENLMQQQDQQLQLRPPENHNAAHYHQPPPPQNCPRCDSSNTKFCYYNNYSLSQPRYFCKACRRYWTLGGTLRNVPVGGGSRKSKRARTQGLSPAIRPQNLTGVVSGQLSRPMPPLMGNSFSTGGSLFPSLAAMQSLSAGEINHAAAANLGVGGSQFGANMALLQGVSLPSWRSPAPPHQFRPTTSHYFPPRPILIPSGPFTSWNQGLINRGGASTSNIWRSNAGGNYQSGPLFTPNQLSDTRPGPNPSH